MINAADIRAAKDILSQCSLGQDQRPCGCALRSLAEHWIRWSKKHYCFQNVRLSETKANSFGDAAKSLMEKEGDGYYMRVKWTVPAKAQKGDTAKIAKRRQLSDTEKKQNAVRHHPLSEIITLFHDVIHHELLTSVIIALLDLVPKPLEKSSNRCRRATGKNHAQRADGRKGRRRFRR